MEQWVPQQMKVEQTTTTIVAEIGAFVEPIGPLPPAVGPVALVGVWPLRPIMSQHTKRPEVGALGKLRYHPALGDLKGRERSPVD